MCKATKPSQLIQLTTPLPMKTTSTNAARSSTEKKRSVSFAKTLKVRFSLALEDYTEAEYNACFYSPEEYQAIEKDMCRQFMKMEQGKVLHDIKSCSRGLEKYLTVNAIQKTENHRTACQAVLDEQSRQAKSGTHDDENIARLYNNVTSSCQLWAAVLGNRDQQEAEKYNQDYDDIWDDLDALTQSQESQESQESPIPQQQPLQLIIAPQERKIPEKPAVTKMGSLRQLAVSARTA